MSIETMTAKAGPFDCDGVQTEFPFAFDPLDSSYLTVYVNSSIVSNGYTTTLNEGGGTVTFATPPASGARVAILRNIPPTQLVDLQNNTAFLPEVIEGMGDKLTALAQQLQEVEERAFVVPPTASGTAKDEIERMISSGGGGGGGGGGSSYDFNPFEFNVTSGGSVSINQINKSKIAGLSDALGEKQDKLTSGGTYHINVDHADTANTASGLTNAAKQDIIGSAGGSAFVYDGPFAVNIEKIENTYYAGMNAGYVVVGGSRHLINGILTEDGIPFSTSPDFDTVFLTLSSGGGVISSGLTMRSDGQAADTVIVRLASAVDDSSVRQIQYGDITTVPWGIGGGGGIMIPNYAKLMGEAYCIVSSGGVAISSTTNLGSGSAYYATANGYLRISLKNASSGASQDCLRVAIGGSDTWIALYDLQSSTEGGCIRGGTQILPISSGSYFRVYSLSNNSVGDVLVKFDHDVSLTAL